MSLDGRSVLVLFAHPAFDKSRVHHRLVAAARELEGIYVHDLYQEYPDFSIDVPREQDLLARHDALVFQHPIFWYSTPSLLKEWQDVVLTHGWAYGSGGAALRGKRFLLALSAGGDAAAYRPGGGFDHELADFLLPITQTARLCGMHVLPPFAVLGAHGLTESAIAGHAEAYRQRLAALRDGDRLVQPSSTAERMRPPLESGLEEGGD